jgi:hypothetical protein
MFRMWRLYLVLTMINIAQRTGSVIQSDSGKKQTRSSSRSSRDYIDHRETAVGTAIRCLSLHVQSRVRHSICSKTYQGPRDTRSAFVLVNLSVRVPETLSAVISIHELVETPPCAQRVSKQDGETDIVDHSSWPLEQTTTPCYDRISGRKPGL